MNDLIKTIQIRLIGASKTQIAWRDLAAVIVMYIIVVTGLNLFIGDELQAQLAQEALKDPNFQELFAHIPPEHQLSVLGLMAITLGVVTVVVGSMIVARILSSWKKVNITTIQVINLYLVSRTVELAMMIAGLLAAAAAAFIYKTPDRLQLVVIMNTISQFILYVILIWGLRMAIDSGMKKK